MIGETAAGRKRVLSVQGGEDIRDIRERTQKTGRTQRPHHELDLNSFKEEMGR
jgi:hypothetical protein